MILEVPGGSWRFLEVLGGSQEFLGVPGGFWRFLEVPGGSWRFIYDLISQNCFSSASAEYLRSCLLTKREEIGS